MPTHGSRLERKPDMLVLSRRSKEKISFPDVGITVHFIRVQSGTAKVGIDAPMQIRIVRDEVCPDSVAKAENVREELLRLPKHLRHSIRNELHTISVGVHLLHEQLQLGMNDDASETFQTIQESLQRLDENRVLRSPSLGEGAVPIIHTGTVLIVEDETNERELLAALQRLRGYEVVSVASAEDALEYLAVNDTPSAILMDMNLPQSDGAFAVRSIRANDQHAGARVYAVSGNSPEEYGLETGRAGVQRWFPKPVDVDNLFETLSAEPALN